ncbi:transcriptional regulator, TetR family [Cohaesibacter sp. ES.047]|uniref:TetR/AcrR family transcriptional regulator n=1 Tax=Cohaesibacter sp. ES.047 TaxID=1798205 RepID=UPI000BB760D4|nr:TetR/AcrR family transcriptional regulator [Cohaesibacter sp. ES.047]SNY91471.1 transcriptional regulator, TetR family [Cohaesibacter sp. ES.047]
MSRIPGSSGEKTLKAIYEAATDLIYLNGYEAVSLRQLAGAVGIQAGSLYNHIASKQDLLYKLTLDIMLEHNAALDDALHDKADPEAALMAFVRSHITYYAVRKKQVFIGNFELRSLTGEHYRQIVLLRDQYEKRLVAILDEGIKRGSWSQADMRVTAKALIAMMTGVCMWYDPKGDYSIDELVKHYQALIMGGVKQGTV